MVLWHAVPLWAARLLRHILTARTALAAGQAWPDPYSASPHRRRVGHGLTPTARRRIADGTPRAWPDRYNATGTA